MGKLSVEAGGGTESEFILSNMDVRTVPSFLGGHCHCTECGGCVPGFPNSANGTEKGGGYCRPVAGGSTSPAGSREGALENSTKHHVNVPAGKETTVAEAVGQGSQVVQWSFDVEDYGIEYEVSINEEVLASGKHKKSVNGALQGEHIVNGPGLVSIRFSNKHSMMRSKDVLYAVAVEPEALGSSWLPGFDQTVPARGGPRKGLETDDGEIPVLPVTQVRQCLECHM